MRFHAELPWAAIRWIVQATIEDTQTFGTALEHVEVIANSVTQCRVLDQLYVRTDFAISNDLYRVIVQQHATTLKYLAEVLRYFGRNTALRFFKAALTVSRKLGDLFTDVERTNVEVQRLANVAETERSERIERNLTGLRLQASQGAEESTQRDAQLLSILAGLRRPLDRIEADIHDLHDSLQSGVCMGILKTISTIPFHTHHKLAAADRLKDSGRWLLQNKTYQAWSKSSNNSYSGCMACQDLVRPS